MIKALGESRREIISDISILWRLLEIFMSLLESRKFMHFLRKLINFGRQCYRWVIKYSGFSFCVLGEKNSCSFYNSTVVYSDLFFMRLYIFHKPGFFVLLKLLLLTNAINKHSIIISIIILPCN